MQQEPRPSGPFDTSDRLKIVLLHGAFSDASGWSYVIPFLHDAGYPVLAIQNNLATLRSDVASTRAVLDQIAAPVLVVGHSYGGAIMGGATHDASNVTGLVYIAAYAPAEGEQLGALSEKFAPTHGGSHFRADKRGFVYIDPLHFGEAFAADAPMNVRRTMAATQRPIHASIFAEAAGPAGWSQHHVWFQISKDDQTIHPELERFFAERMNATTIELASSHASPVAHPREVADFILQACKNERGRFQMRRARFFSLTAAPITAAIVGLPALSRAAAQTSTGETPMTTLAPNAATDPRIDPEIRSFLAELNKDSSPYWELPGPQVRAVLTGLQRKTPVDMSGVTTTDVTIGEGTLRVKLYIMKPENVTAALPVTMFIHGGVWIAGDFENHQRLVRDLVVGTAAAAVFVEYTPIPDAVFPTQLEQCYAAAKWIVDHGHEHGLDGARLAVAGNSVGGDMSAALMLMTKDRGGPRFLLQVLLFPATATNFETDSYEDFESGRFLSRAFMKFGWDIYAPDSATRRNPYAVPMAASLAQLQGVPPALVITVENDPLRDEGEAFSRRLKEAGVPVTAIRYNGTIHDFMLLNALHDHPSTLAAIRQASDAIKGHFIA